MQPTLAGLTTLLADDPVVAAATGGLARPVAVPEAGPRALRRRRSPAPRPAARSCSRSRPGSRPNGSPPTCASTSATTRSSSSRRGRRCRSSASRPRPRRWAGACASSGACAPGASISRGRSSRRCARSCSGSARTSKTSSRSSCAGRAARSRRARRAARRRSATGASTRSRRAARSRCAVRSSTCIPRPPTIRCASICGATRSTGCRSSRSPISARRSRSPSRGSSRCASCCRPTRCAPAPASCCETQPWGREQWERLAEGNTFDGMESWLPWLTADEHLLPDLLPATRARRDRRAPPPARPRPGAARRGSRARADARDHVGRAGRRGRHAAPVAPVRPAARAHEGATGAGARRARLARHAGARGERVRSRSSATPTRSAQRLNALKRDGFRVFVAAEGSGSADRIEQILADEGVAVDRITDVPDGGAVLRAPGIHIVVAPLDRGAVLPAQQLALVAEADLTGRRRVHRRPRGARKGLDHYEGLAVGDFVVHRVHGVGRYLGMETKEMFGVTRDRLVVEFKGGDRVYVDSEDIGLIRKYTGGEEPKLSKMGGADWEKTRARVRKAVRDIAGELVVLYRRRLATPGHAFGPDTPFQHQIEEAFPYEETPDQAKAIDRDQGRHGTAGPDGPAHLRRRRLRQDRGRVARRGEGGVRRQAGRDPRADHAAREPARPDVPRALRELPGAGRGAVAVPHGEGTERRRQGRARRHRRHRHRHAPAARRRHRVQGPRPARRRRGATLRRAAQGADQGVAHERRRADAHRHADPAHARDVAHRHSRSLVGEHAARGSPTDPHVRQRVRRARGVARRSGASCCAKVRCSTCTTACTTSRTSPTT